MPHNRLVAWIDPRDELAFVAAFVAAAVRRPPATRECTSVNEAKQWVEDQAARLGDIPVEWVEPRQ